MSDNKEQFTSLVRRKIRGRSILNLDINEDSLRIVDYGDWPEIMGRRLVGSLDSWIYTAPDRSVDVPKVPRWLKWLFRSERVQVYGDVYLHPNGPRVATDIETEIRESENH